MIQIKYDTVLPLLPAGAVRGKQSRTEWSNIPEVSEGSTCMVMAYAFKTSQVNKVTVYLHVIKRIITTNILYSCIMLSFPGGYHAQIHNLFRCG